MSLLAPLLNWFQSIENEQIRAIDLSTRWPALRALARTPDDIDHARAAFAAHAFHDAAWLELGEVEIKRIIGELE